jgi:hypothetical protein
LKSKGSGSLLRGLLPPVPAPPAAAPAPTDTARSE